MPACGSSNRDELQLTLLLSMRLFIVYYPKLIYSNFHPLEVVLKITHICLI